MCPRRAPHCNRILSSILLLGLLFGVAVPAEAREANNLSASLPSASTTAPASPKRLVNIEVDVQIYEWWLLSWQNSEVLCQIYTEHETWPDSKEVLYYCGAGIQKQWLATRACEYSDTVTKPEECHGLYLHQASVTPSKRKIEVTLPNPEVSISVVNCERQAGQRNCSSLPSLRFEALEPLPNEQIIRIVGKYNGMAFSCPVDICDLPLSPTGMKGVAVEFWAESSYGDASEHYTAQVRAIPWGEFANPDSPSPDKPTYFVDVLSSQWKGEAQSSCSGIWQAFQPVEGPPEWLSTPENANQLSSNTRYYLLAGSLIRQGLVDALGCPNGGLETNGAANACGMEAAKDTVFSWQNQFDSEIIRVAKDTGIPAQLMKNIFSRESQFWPGIYSRVSEAGLGHLSDMGADAVLLWNPAFYEQFCPLVLHKGICQRGFGNLDLAQQKLLRGALVQRVNASCPNCPIGIDLSQANFSISIFARSLLANCEQVGQIFYNNTGRKAGTLTTYEDLWKLTLLNYNAGSGCLNKALQRTINNGNDLSWENISANLEPACQGARSYIAEVSRNSASDPLQGLSNPIPSVGGNTQPSNPTPGVPSPSTDPSPYPIVNTPEPVAPTPYPSNP